MTDEGAGPYRCVVVGTDGSDTAVRAVARAAELAARSGARLFVVTAFVRRPDQTAELRARAPDDVRWQLSDRNLAEERAREGKALAREAGVTEVVALADEGDADEVLLSVATDRGADLIVVGSKGMASARRFVLGSVANRISHHAPCDVMIVHTAP